jgi:hypothetical protein
MPQLTRVYRNSSDEDLRIDTITAVPRFDNFVIGPTGGQTYLREKSTILIYGSANRTVSEIQVIGDFSSAETSSGNFIWVSWNKPSIDMDLSDLPFIGDEV